MKKLIALIVVLALTLSCTTMAFAPKMREATNSRRKRSGNSSAE